MQGKRGMILGVANNRSIAWGIAKACHAAGAEIALTWQGDALKKRVEPLAKELGGILLGVAQGIGAHIDPGWQMLAGHLAFLIVLAARPEGLFPKIN